MLYILQFVQVAYNWWCERWRSKINSDWTNPHNRM